MVAGAAPKASAAGPRSRTKAIFWLAAVGAALALHGLLFWLDERPSPRLAVGDEGHYLRTAERLAAGSEVAPNLFWPPFYARFLAAFGASASSARWVQTALLVAVAVLLARSGRRIGLERPAARILGMLVLLYPPLAAYAHYLWPEVLHLGLLAAALWILAARSRTPVWMAVLGLVLGLAVLTKSLLQPFLPVFALAVVLRRSDAGGTQRPSWARRGLYLALAGATFAVTVAPTVVAHGRATGTWAIADSGRFNAWVGLNDRSPKDWVDPVVIDEHGAYLRSGATHGERQEVLRRKIATLVDELGVAALARAQLGRQYFRLFDKDSFFTDMLPEGAIWTFGRGYRDAPAAIATPLRGWSYAAYALLLLVAPFGFATALAAPGPRLRRGWIWAALAFVAYNLALFAVLHVKSRYRIQLLPCFFYGVALAVDWWHRGRPSLGLGAWLGAAAAAALLLFLAFVR